MNIQTGVIESAAAIPLAEALKRWRREAAIGEITTGRHRSRFFAWGRGQPLVFIHGMTDRARSFVPVIAHLTQSFQCIAYEMSDQAPMGKLRHADLVNGLFDLIDELRLGQVCLYGASFGSTVALRALQEEPRRFLRAAMHGAFARRTLSPAERLVLRFAAHSSGRLRDLAPFRRLQRRADAPEFAGVDPSLWEFQRANTGGTPIAVFARRALILEHLDLRPILPTVRHPVMLISGDHDAPIFRTATEELAALLPHADRLEFAGAGHSPHYTHAAALAETLRRFLLPPCGMTG